MAAQGPGFSHGSGFKPSPAAAQESVAPADWLSKPLRRAWIADPLVLDCAFQLMIAWSTALKGAASLPCHLGSYRQYRRRFPRESLRCVIRVSRSTEQRALADIEFVDDDGRLVASIEGYECVIDKGLAAAFRQNQLAEEAEG